MPRKALLLGRNDDSSLRWCCNYDPDGGDEHGLAPCDVRKMRDALKAHGYEVQVVGSECQTEGQITDTVKAAVRDCAEEDQFLFYFSGHALTRDGELELLLAPAPDTESFLSSRLIAFLQACRASTKLLILDTCYAQGVTQVWLPKRYDNLRILVATKTLVRGKEVDGLVGGIFTHCLCEALTQPAHWRPDGLDALVDADGHIYSHNLLRWLKRRIPEVGKRYRPGESFPEPTADAGQDDPFLIASVAISPKAAPEVGYPPQLLQSLDVALRELGVGHERAAAGYTYCRACADADILPYLPQIDRLDWVIAVLTEPGRYYFAGNRLKLPLLSFVAYLSKGLDHPTVLEDWLTAAKGWLIETGAIAQAHADEAAIVLDPPTQAQGQPLLMVQVAPDLASAPSRYAVSWDYIDEYGEPTDGRDPSPDLGTDDAVIAQVLAAVRSLTGRTPCKPQVEVLLPFALLSDDAFVDKLERALYRPGERLPLDRLTLGDLAAEFPLVLRCWERWFEPLLVNNRGGTDARAFWHDHAACLRRASRPPCLHWLKANHRQPIQSSALLHLRARHPDQRALALGCCDPIPCAGLAALLDIGVPILLWPRHRAPSTTGLNAIKQGLASNPSDPTLKALPRALYQHRCREAARQGTTPCDFSLLWEDPDRPIFDQPDYDASAMG